MEAEKAHHFTMSILQALSKTPRLFPGIFQSLPKENAHDCMGMKFPSRIGLAAGFDKNAEYLSALSKIGFGFVEIGTVTPKGQEGNPKPRLFRLKKDRALINRMGFNNKGLNTAIEHLKKRPEGLIVGGNIGKNKHTPNQEAVLDYERSFEALYPYVDYFVVNVSSPNTPNLRELQEIEPLREILSKLLKIRNSKDIKLPLLLKVAPDLSNTHIDQIAALVKEIKLDGIVATNTTVKRPSLTSTNKEVKSIGAGGLSGKPLFPQSLHVVKQLRKSLPSSDFTIIAVGGISNYNQAEQMLDAGADLLQVYTGFVYNGPQWIRKIGAQVSHYLKN